MASVKQLKEMIFEDLRIDTDAFFSLDIEKLRMLIPKYKSKNLMFLQKLFKRETYANLWSNVEKI